MTRGELAARVECSPGAITQMLQADYDIQQSSHVPAIHAALGLPAPSDPLPVGDIGELGYIWDNLSPGTRDAIMHMARMDKGRK